MTTLKMSNLTQNGGVHEWFTLVYHSKDAGQLLLDTRYVAPGAPATGHHVAVGAGVGAGAGPTMHY